MQSIHHGATLNIYQSPGHTDIVLMPNGEVWTIRNQMNPNGWTLFDANNKPHPTIQRIPSMLSFCGAINEYAETIAQEAIIQ